MENINIDFSEKEFQKIKANKHNYEKIGNETLYDKDNLIKILLKISAVVFLFIPNLFRQKEKSRVCLC